MNQNSAKVMRTTTYLFLALLLASSGAADEPKNHDFDVIREEAMVPPYQLPPLLVSSEGKPI